MRQEATCTTYSTCADTEQYPMYMALSIFIMYFYKNTYVSVTAVATDMLAEVERISNPFEGLYE